MKRNKTMGVEVRCIMINGLEHEQSWPDSGNLYLNRKKAMDFKPLYSNSPFKKRKDVKYFIRIT